MFWSASGIRRDVSQSTKKSCRLRRTASPLSMANEFLQCKDRLPTRNELNASIPEDLDVKVAEQWSALLAEGVQASMPPKLLLFSWTMLSAETCLL